MYNLPRYLQFEIIKFISPRWFVNYLCVNKKTLEDVKEYLKYKKNIYESEKICKTYKNCLYKLNNINNSCFEYVSNSQNMIVKLVSIKPINNGEKYKIIFWVLSQMKKIGNLPVSYPDWSIVKTIDKDKFIPFY